MLLVCDCFLPDHKIYENLRGESFFGGPISNIHVFHFVYAKQQNTQINAQMCRDMYGSLMLVETDSNLM
jgi:hypothetical protein